MTPHPELLGSLAQDPDLKFKLTNFLQHKAVSSDLSSRTVSSLERVSGTSLDVEDPGVLEVIRTTPGER